MAEIKPFKAVMYDREKNGDLSAVMCPPYDVISPAAQERYHQAHENNLIHILLGRDTPGEDKYKRAGALFREWQKQGVFIQDKVPAIYFYIQKYKVRGETRTRFGFIARLRLTDKNASVFAHEHTRQAPKEDRRQLIRQVHANLSPIFAIFPDHKRIIKRIFQNFVSGQQPIIEVTDEEKTVHQLWRVDSPKALEIMQDGMRDENIFIADGHHRYEVAGGYRDEMRQKLGEISGEEDFNFILTYFTNPDPHGLLVMPIHRLLRLDTPPDMEKLKERLQEYFLLEEFKDRNKFFFLMEKGGRTEHLLGVYKDRKFWLLRLKNIKIVDRLIMDKPVEYRSLDVSILNYIVLHKILGYNPEARDNLTFSPIVDDFIAQVDADPLHIAFFLNPVRVDQIMAVALKGERMPPKSTYFYPKVLSGLVIHKFEDR